MNALIIAAGEGSRLLQEGSETLKPLVKINGESMIIRLLKILKSNGFEKIYIIVNQQSLEVKEKIESSKLKLDINFIIKSTPSSLHSLQELSKVNFGEPFYLFTVDTIFKQSELKNYIDYCESQKQQDAIMGITSFIDDEKPLYVKLHKDRITAFVDKNENCKYVTGGLYYFRKDIRAELDETVAGGIFRLRNFLRALCAKDFKIGYYDFPKIIDVDHIGDIQKAEDFLMSEI